MWPRATKTLQHYRAGVSAAVVTPRVQVGIKGLGIQSAACCWCQVLVLHFGSGAVLWFHLYMSQEAMVHTEQQGFPENTLQAAGQTLVLGSESFIMWSSRDSRQGSTREAEIAQTHTSALLIVHTFRCVYVCVWERERGRERGCVLLRLFLAAISKLNSLWFD